MFGLRIWRACPAQNSKGPKSRLQKPPAPRNGADDFGIWRLEFGFCALPARLPRPLAFTGALAPIGFFAGSDPAWEFVMRYRSATVAGFHGLP
jgi:hypothetical protein